eukprot:TRINITY_DN7742_c0_g1_i2.p1 TRINITY_DN7742_c0_g1~~TRINITY_DN7742_c0_g1_i2.p1  ORF type:complete len:641 (+),score=97.16 TRINITY_DN7742_c0_g1_i2:458-2380(+)
MQQVGDRIGKGAFGEVFKGLDVATGKFVAIKQIQKKRIKNSAKATAEVEFLKSFHHPNIVRYIGVVEDDMCINYVLEYIESGSLEHIVKKFGVFSETLTGLYIEQVLRGLCYLHSKGVIHRDIKAANILITKKGKVKLADFGIATSVTGSEVDDSIPCGSPFWMAPEVIQMDTATPAADIWSLGCTIIELLEGVPPYFELGAMQAMYTIVNEQEPPSLPENISQELQEILLKCFLRDPTLRPSADSLLKSKWVLKKLYNDQPTETNASDLPPPATLMSLKNLSIALAKFNDTPITPELLPSDESEVEAVIEKKKKKKGSRKGKSAIDPMAKEGEKPRKHGRRRTVVAKPLSADETSVDPAFRSQSESNIPHSRERTTTNSNIPWSQSEPNVRIQDDLIQASAQRLNKEKLLSLQQSFGNGLKFKLTDNPKRIYIRDGLVNKICRRGVSKRRQMFLFNDILIYASFGTLGRYTFHRILKTVDMQVLPTKEPAHAFKILGAEKSFIVSCDSEEDKESWMSDIARVCEQMRSEIQELLPVGYDPKSFQAPVWIPDNEVNKCMLCQVSFTTLRRRHHCRKCGQIVCASCSNLKAYLPHISVDVPQRVCTKCAIEAPHDMRLLKRRSRSMSSLSPPPAAWKKPQA